MENTNLKANSVAQPLNVLVVDDDSIVRLVHNRILARAGYTTMQAQNGVEAVGLARQHAFDVILMDLNMPVMNGLEATEKIRAQEAGKHHACIIGVTGFGDLAHDDCMAKGMDLVLTKPVEAEELVRVVNQACR